MKISEKNKQKIAEHILSSLFEASPKPQFTSHIAKEIIRDEEFTKSLLLDLEIKKLVVRVIKNPKGVAYTRRMRWRLTDQAFKALKERFS
jgi:hypothetical protein